MQRIGDADSLNVDRWWCTPGDQAYTRAVKFVATGPMTHEFGTDDRQEVKATNEHTPTSRRPRDPAADHMPKRARRGPRQGTRRTRADPPSKPASTQPPQHEYVDGVEHSHAAESAAAPDDESTAYGVSRRVRRRLHNKTSL